MPPINKFVVDTSALLALRGDESGADRVEGLIAQAKRNRCELLASFMSRMEILYIVWRAEGEDGATLVHKDPEFEPFKEIPQEVLK